MTSTIGGVNRLKPPLELHHYLWTTIARLLPETNLGILGVAHDSWTISSWALANTLAASTSSIRPVKDQHCI